MKITGKKETDTYAFYEDERKIYTIKDQSEKGLIRLTLYNQLNHEVYEVFQLINWKDRFRKYKYDFAVYEGEDKIAEFTSLKNGYEVEYYGVYYRIELGTYEEKPCLFVKKSQSNVDYYIIDDELTLVLNHSNDHALHICFAYLFKMYLYH